MYIKSTYMLSSKPFNTEAEHAEIGHPGIQEDWSFLFSENICIDKRGQVVKFSKQKYVCEDDEFSSKLSPTICKPLQKGSVHIRGLYEILKEALPTETYIPALLALGECLGVVLYKMCRLFL